MNHELGFTVCGCNVLSESTRNPKLTYPWKFGRSFIQTPGVRRFNRVTGSLIPFLTWLSQVKKCFGIYFHYNGTMFILDIVWDLFPERLHFCNTTLAFHRFTNNRSHLKKSWTLQHETYGDPKWYHENGTFRTWFWVMDRSPPGEDQRWSRPAME